MQIINIKQFIGLVVLLLSAAGLALASDSVARAGDNKSPDLPPACSSLQVEFGNKMHSRVYAIGVQVYRWNGASWVFVEPVANLYADAGFHGKVGIHYVGPTWESNSGSRVVAARVPGTGCTPDPTAIPWLLLKTVTNDGPGIYSKVTFIQRVNTTGGLSPQAPGSIVGEEKRVPYTAEYYFYRAHQD